MGPLRSANDLMNRTSDLQSSGAGLHWRLPNAPSLCAPVRHHEKNRGGRLGFRDHDTGSFQTVSPASFTCCSSRAFRLSSSLS